MTCMDGALGRDRFGVTHLHHSKPYRADRIVMARGGGGSLNDFMGTYYSINHIIIYKCKFFGI